MHYGHDDHKESGARDGNTETLMGPIGEDESGAENRYYEKRNREGSSCVTVDIGVPKWFAN